MAFQLPKANHKAIFDKHRRDRAIKRKIADETAPAADVEASPVQTGDATADSDRSAARNEPVNPALQTTVHEGATVPVTGAEMSEKDIKPKDDNKDTKPEQADQSKNSRKGIVRPAPSKKASPLIANGGDTISLKIRIAFPQAGQSKAYDSLASQIGQQQAVRMLLKRAFEDLRERLRTENKLPAAPSYLPTKDRFVTNKIISVSELTIAKASLDPSGIMNPMMFNRTLAERALALFFQKENESA